MIRLTRLVSSRFILASFACSFLVVVTPANFVQAQNQPVMTATICVPGVDYSSVREGGRPATSSPDVTFLKVDGSYSLYQTGSGDYTFDATLPASGSN